MKLDKNSIKLKKSQLLKHSIQVHFENFQMIHLQSIPIN